MNEPLYKVTNLDGSSFHGGTGKWIKNRWRTVTGDVIACENGLHACTIEQLPAWLGPAIWRFEYEGEIVTASDKVVVRKGRVTEKFTTWNKTTARLFAADCAEHVLPLCEKRYPNDKRPREAIEVARKFARGEATREQRDVAGAAARAAAWAAAWTAAWDAWGAAGAAEIRWQAARLLDYLEGRAK